MATTTTTTQETTVHTRCCYCGIFYPLGARHFSKKNKCPNPPPYCNPDEQGRYTCFTCGKTEGFGWTGKKVKNRFTEKERRKGERARCKTCVANNLEKRFKTFSHGDQSLGQKLNDIVGIYPPDPDAVAKLLSEGADPNHVRQARVPFHGERRFRMVPVWNDNGTPIPEEDQDFLQPTRPLPQIVFGLSNALNTADDCESYANIAQLLIDAGADLFPAVQMMEHRHGAGVPDEETLERRRSWSAALVTRNARNNIQLLLNECKLASIHNGGYDFASYFSKSPSQVPSDCLKLTPKAARASSWLLRRYYEKNIFNRFLKLTPKAVRASSELRPYYEKYIFNRFRSHSATLFGREREQQQDEESSSSSSSSSTKMYLPALPHEIEARIRTAALLGTGPFPVRRKQHVDAL